MKHEQSRVWVVLVILVRVSLGALAAGAEEQVLFDFSAGLDMDRVQTTDTSVRRVHGGLELTTGHEQPWPGICLKAAQGKWDLSQFAWVAMDLRNSGSERVTVYCRVDNPEADGRAHCLTGQVSVDPGQEALLTVRLHETAWALSEPLELMGMRGFPQYQGKLDPANVTQVLVFVAEPSVDHRFVIGNVHAGGEVTVLDSTHMMPLIDEYGQFMHADWPGKIHSPQDLTRQRRGEDQDLARHPGPSHWNQYGGWAQGPALEATGFFRVQKLKGKWWLVDPKGRLFWSHGIDCVNLGSSTPISDREHYFKQLPDVTTPLGHFYGQGDWAPHGFYKDHRPYRTYDFGRANMQRKYGDNAAEQFSVRTHQRLRSWGLNTIGNWSQNSICQMRCTPYVATVNVRSRQIAGSSGYWGRFPDPFDPSFRRVLRRAVLAKQDREINDPWCLGFFVDNELAWGTDVSLSLAALKSPADQPAKQTFVERLTARYQTVERLNQIWGTSYASWQALLDSTAEPDQAKARADLTAFYTHLAERYFGIIREELKRLAPHQLYLGCRFAWVNDRAAQAAFRFCDVIAYNRYDYSVKRFRLPQDLDRPVIIGEFHFGALDRGMFHTGLKPVQDQQDRAAKYRSYVYGALENPQIVGTHWFQYRDQATTGRGDGENYQIGFIDICDTPYSETIKACREVGYRLYQHRMEH